MRRQPRLPRAAIANLARLRPRMHPASTPATPPPLLLQSPFTEGLPLPIHFKFTLQMSSQRSAYRDATARATYERDRRAQNAAAAAAAAVSASSPASSTPAAASPGAGVDIGSIEDEEPR